MEGGKEILKFEGQGDGKYGWERERKIRRKKRHIREEKRKREKRPIHESYRHL